MKVKKGEYFIIRLGSAKPQLAKCVELGENGRHTGFLERDKQTAADNIYRIEFEDRDVLCVLGKFPKAGSVYGVKVEPLLEKFESNFWGQVRIYQKMDDKRRNKLKDGLNQAKKLLKQADMPKLPIDLEVRQPHGKYSGWYKYQPQEERDITCIKPDEQFQNFMYVIMHEYGHGIYFRKLSLKGRARWINLYHEFVTLSQVTEKELTDILDDINSEGSIYDYLKSCEDDILLVVKHVLRHIQNVHGLNKKHLEIQLNSGNKIDEYWPLQLEVSDKQIAITEYAKKSPEELFAETFAFYLTGAKINDKLAKAMKKTLDNVKE